MKSLDLLFALIMHIPLVHLVFKEILVFMTQHLELKEFTPQPPKSRLNVGCCFNCANVDPVHTYKYTNHLVGPIPPSTNS